MDSYSHDQDIVVFSHLRWEFVTQRPQHIMKRMSRNRRVLYVEEPIAPNGIIKGKYRLIHPKTNLWVLQIWSNRIDAAVFASIINPILRQLEFDAQPMLWFYSPAFVKLASLAHSLVIYDCMDELSQFKGASKKILDYEQQLLKHADLVFTGGRSLYELKRQKHPRVYCFPSSVDKQHFVKASLGTLKIPKKIHLPHPILGYYGVIDERLDRPLMRESAKKSPESSFVYIGPVVKIKPTSLPRLPNIHYLGMVPYAQLPRYLQAFDIAFMPFALNRATQFISPTKTLEFIAAHKPIISTPIKDVVATYASLVKIVQTPLEVKTAIASWMQESVQSQMKRLQHENTILTQSSWARTVSEMNRLINKLLNPQLNTLSKHPSFHALTLQRT